MTEIQSTITANLTRLQDHNAMLNQTQLSIADLGAKVFDKKTFLETTQFPYPRIQCTHVNCTKRVATVTEAGDEFKSLHNICFDEKDLVNDILFRVSPQAWNLWFPSLLLNCQKCNHPLDNHQHTNLEYKQVVKTVENPVVKRQIEDQESAEVIQKDLIKANED